jgi:hypothetical protein
VALNREMSKIEKTLDTQKLSFFFLLIFLFIFFGHFIFEKKKKKNLFRCARRLFGVSSQQCSGLIVQKKKLKKVR